MDLQLTYADYMRGRPRNAGEAPDGQFIPPMSEEEWNALGEDEKFDSLTQGFQITSDDPRWKPLAEAVHETDPDRAIWIGRPQGRQGFSTDWMIDPNRVGRTENGYVFSTSGNESAENQARNDFGVVQHGWLLPVAAWAIGAAGAMGGAEAGAAEAGAGTAGAGEVGAGTFSNVVGGSSTTAGTAGTAGVAGATGAATAPAAANTGIISNAFNGVGEWYSGLSPAARLVVNQGISTGVSALSSAAQQRAASEAADERQRQQEEDRIRRTTVTRFAPGAFTPRPGLIGSRFTPRGG